MENQSSMMNKIKLMENKWKELKTKGISLSTRHLHSEILERDGQKEILTARINEAKAILRFMQRGSIFDLPKFCEENK